MRCRCAHCAKLFIRLGNTRYCSPECVRAARSIVWHSLQYQKQKQRRLRQDHSSQEPTRNIARAASVIAVAHQDSRLQPEIEEPYHMHGKIAELQSMLVQLTTQLLRQKVAYAAAAGARSILEDTMAGETSGSDTGSLAETGLAPLLFQVILEAVAESCGLHERSVAETMRANHYGDVGGEIQAMLSPDEGRRLVIELLTATSRDPTLVPLVQQVALPAVDQLFGSVAPDIRREVPTNEDGGGMSSLTRIMASSSLDVPDLTPTPGASGDPQFTRFSLDPQFQSKHSTESMPDSLGNPQLFTPFTFY